MAPLAPRGIDVYFLQQLVAGLAIGLVYGGLALAVALVYKGGGALNVTGAALLE
jgi:branched-subunit amino acid ABC-type transport system permease component